MLLRPVVAIYKTHLILRALASHVLAFVAVLQYVVRFFGS